jgi:hypothetical protein
MGASAGLSAAFMEALPQALRLSKRLSANRIDSSFFMRIPPYKRHRYLYRRGKYKKVPKNPELFSKQSGQHQHGDEHAEEIPYNVENRPADKGDEIQPHQTDGTVKLLLLLLLMTVHEKSTDKGREIHKGVCQDHIHSFFHLLSCNLLKLPIL